MFCIISLLNLYSLSPPPLSHPNPPPPIPSLRTRLLWAVLIPLTARLRLLHLHQLLSNMALKACLAVPTARAATALLQLSSSFSAPPPPPRTLPPFSSAAPVTPPLAGEAQAYYGGIAAATAVFGAWQLGSLRHFLAVQHQKV